MQQCCALLAATLSTGGCPALGAAALRRSPLRALPLAGSCSYERQPLRAVLLSTCSLLVGTTPIADR
ncbi:hypothetical protein BHE74_00057813 [Ensete ventricosum]|nr:hypothetical protein GW17_00016785 [Ensete ventricosum]RWW37116.1 hypothetical protein BHE74_00057813 [Ensete ventricosum]RZR79138.1 hypothetical protein BHM03_00004770 [Ensete ventricosum]